MVATETIRESGFENVPHPPYSADLTPSSIHLLPIMKKALAGQRFANDNEVIDAAEELLGTQEKEFFQIGEGIPLSLEQVCFTRWRLH